MDQSLLIAKGVQGPFSCYEGITHHLLSAADRIGLGGAVTIAAGLAMVIILLALPALRRRRAAMEAGPDPD